MHHTLMMVINDNMYHILYPISTAQKITKESKINKNKLPQSIHYQSELAKEKRSNIELSKCFFQFIIRNTW